MKNTVQKVTHMKLLSSLKLNCNCNTCAKFNLQNVEASNLPISIYICKFKQGD